MTTRAYLQSYLLTRLAIGVSLFGHGLQRFSWLDKFSHGMATEFANSILPAFAVLGFGYLLPFAEFTIGLLLILGLFTRPAAVAGSILMILLIFGTTTIGKWDNIPSQLLHIVFLLGVLVCAGRYDKWSLDLFLGLQRTGGAAE